MPPSCQGIVDHDVNARWPHPQSSVGFRALPQAF